MSCREGLRLLFCKVFVLKRMGWTKQESVCHLLFCLLGKSGLTLAFECGIGNQNCSGHLSFPLRRYSRWLGSNPKIAPDVIASEARPAASRGGGGPGGLWPPRRCLQRGEGSLALPAACEGGQPFPTPLPSHSGFASGAQAQPVPLLPPFSTRNQINSCPW